MNSLYRFYLAAFLTLPGVAHAQDAERSPFTGPHVAVEANRDFNEAQQTPTSPERKRAGYGFRGAAGYDAALGSKAIIGAEIGVGTGGRTISQPSLGGGTYRVNPGVTYDLTGRAGIAPIDKLLIYGRGGYRWLKTRQDITGQALGNTSFKLTEKGFTYGAGVEAALTKNIALRAEFDRTNYSKNFSQNKAAIGAVIRF